MRQLIGICVLLMASTAWAESIRLPVQGVVRTQAGAPVPDGAYSFLFRVYPSQTSDTVIWEGTQPSVQLKDGVFTTVLGHNTLNALKSEYFSDNKEVWIAVKVASELEMPRKRINAAPFSAYSHSAGALSCTACITTDHLSNVVLQAKSITWVQGDGNSTVQEGLDMLAQKANGVQSTLDQHSVKLTDMGQQLDTLSSSSKSQKSLLDTLTTQASGTESTVVKHTATLADLEKEVSSMSTTVASNSQTATALQSTAKGHADDIQKANVNIDKNTQSLQALTTTLNTVKSEVTQNADSISTNNKLQTSQQNQINTVDKTATANKSDIGSLKLGLQSANGQLQTLDTQVSTNTQTISKHTGELKTLNDSVTAQGKSLVATQTTVSEHSGKLTAVTETANGADAAVTSLQKTVATVAGMANASKNDITDLQILSKQNQSSAKVANESAKVNANVITATEASLEAKIAAANQDIGKNSGELTKLQNQLNQTGTTLSNAIATINSNGTKITSLEALTGELTLAVATLKTDLAKINTNLDFTNKLLITVVDSQTTMDETPAAARVVYRSDENRLWIYANNTWRRIMVESACGDKVIDKAEECDDGNSDNNDGCIACKKATCGDGIIYTGVEDCDDSNNNVNDSCVACKKAACGDGFIQTGVEVCDTNQFAGATCASVTGQNYTGNLECNNNCQAIGTGSCKGPLGTQTNPSPSCEQIELSNPANKTGKYWLDMDGTGPNQTFQGWCDFDTDDGPYTWAKFSDGSLGGDQDAYANFCAKYGMQVVVPRTKPHAKAISAQLNGLIPNLVNVFPKTNGATGLNNWQGICKGNVPCENNGNNTNNRNFFVASHESNADCQNTDEQVPNGNNTTSYRLYRIGDGCEWGRWDDGNNSVSITGWVVCSPNDS